MIYKTTLRLEKGIEKLIKEAAKEAGYNTLNKYIIHILKKEIKK